jgi:hypothetical protein
MSFKFNSHRGCNHTSLEVKKIFFACIESPYCSCHHRLKWKQLFVQRLSEPKVMRLFPDHYRLSSWISFEQKLTALECRMCSVWIQNLVPDRTFALSRAMTYSQCVEALKEARCVLADWAVEVSITSLQRHSITSSPPTSPILVPFLIDCRWEPNSGLVGLAKKMEAVGRWETSTKQPEYTLQGWGYLSYKQRVKAGGTRVSEFVSALLRTNICDQSFQSCLSAWIS